jgi:hypothetical protein
LTTTYLDRNKQQKKLQFGGISQQCAVFQPAYGKLRQPFNCSVVQHFYARHRIRLIHPYLHCVIEKFNTPVNEARYYPIELLTLERPLGDENFGSMTVGVDLDDEVGNDEVSIEGEELSIGTSDEDDKDEEVTLDEHDEDEEVTLDKPEDEEVSLDGRDECSQLKKNCWFCGSDNRPPMFSQIF